MPGRGSTNVPHDDARRGSWVRRFGTFVVKILQSASPIPD